MGIVSAMRSKGPNNMTKPSHYAQRVKVIANCSGEWVTVGDTYTVTRRRDARRAHQAHFWNDERQAGTFMTECQFARFVKSGAIQIVEG